MNEHSPRNNGFKINKGLYFIDVDKFKNKKSSDLWEKKQRIKFFCWIFSLLIAICGIVALSVTQIVVWKCDEQIFKDYYLSIDSDLTESGWSMAWRVELINMIISLTIQVVMLVSLVLSIFKCIKFKSFKYISFLPTMFIFIQAIYGIISLIRYAILNVNIVDSFKISWIYIVQFIMMFAYLLIWFFISRNVGLIRRISYFVEMNEEMMKKMNGVFGANSDGNPFFTAPNSEQNTAETGNTSQYDQNDAFYIRLKKLSRDQLNELAKQLSISGYESMTDDEIIKIIYDIRNVQAPHTEREIKIEKPEQNDDESLNNEN